VKILHRYVLREHLGPLVFALTALTSILLLQYVGKNIGQLVGKGLSPWVIVEFFALSVPLTIALTLPMAVLVATLYAFSRLAAENEITALKASGVSLISVLKPVLWAASGITLLMIVFNDQVLPRANHQLAILQRDIAQKKPTFGLREQVINEVSPGKFYLRAGHLDENSNRMREVTIYDMGDPSRRRTIYADSGNMQLSKGMNDLELTLYDGNMQDVPTANATELQRLYFKIDFVRMRGVGNQFEKSTTDSYKGNREMTVCEMYLARRRALADYSLAEQDFVEAKKQAAEAHLALSPAAQKLKPKHPGTTDISSLYCKLVNLFRVKTAHAETLQPEHAASSTQAASSTVAIIQRPVFQPTHTVTGTSIQGAPVSAQVDQTVNRLTESAETMNELSVEVNKKFALAVACFVFVLLGAPIALRFPRGGVGLTIGVSLFVFAFYYVCLIGGQALGNRGLISPAISMWMADVLFAAIALWLLARMGAEGSTARGGDARELLDTVKGWVKLRIPSPGERRARRSSL
jgi:lipopolysaccharide export system permease protein